MERRVVNVVPHTHWDREWYSPFQAFRLRLVQLLDVLLPQLDADPSFAHFMLDGQMAVVDDHLAIRPEAEPALRRLAASGRLSVGPWYILMDEFLVSGETIIRNAQRGFERAAAFGGAMEVGYLPDMFGHIAQMPQLLRQLGLEHAVVWRGVPSAIDRAAFWWTAPDGSTVRTEYLPQGYGNGARMPDDAKEALERVGAFVDEWSSFLAGPVLWMNGTDHQMPQQHLGRLVTEVNDLASDVELRVTSMEEHVRTAPTAGLPTWEGELRSGARANLLMGVASNRVDVKQAAARAERALEREAEPLSALLLPPERWPAALLDVAWLEVIRNSAHDSICACSVDEVCDAVLHRYEEATAIANGLADDALAALGRATAGAGTLVVNPSSRDRSGLVTIDVGGVEDRPGAQVLRTRSGPRVVHGVRRPVAEQMVRDLRNDGITATIEPGPADRVDLRIDRPPSQRLLVRARDVPAYGWRPWDPADRDRFDVEPVDVADGGRRITNGLVTVAIAADGTFALGGVGGLGRLVRDGDVGDTYNWCPPADDVVVDEPAEVAVRAVETGPLRARVELDRTYAWPVPTTVTTVLELHAGERFLRAAVGWDNRSRDQRVRAWFPLPSAAATSEAECAFAVVERGLTAEGGPTEDGIPTFPSRRFVRAGGLTVAHEGLLEYELLDVRDGAAHSLALTLARCTGMLSQGPMATRSLPAGPFTRMEGPQLQQRLDVRFAVQVGDVDPYALVDDAFVPLRLVDAGGGTGPREGQGLRVSGAEVSALRRTAGGRLELRVFNPTGAPVNVAVHGRTGWLVDLRGRSIEPFAGAFPLGPWRIATAVLDP